MAKKKALHLKRTIKFLATNKNPKLLKAVLKEAGNPLIKSICNAAINVAQGDVQLSQKQKRLLRSHRKYIQSLIQKGEPVARKRKLLNQKGGALAAVLIPILLSTVLSSIGSALFSK